MSTPSRSGYTIECDVPFTYRTETFFPKNATTDDEAREEFKKLRLMPRDAWRPRTINHWTSGNPIPRVVSSPPFENPVY